MAKYIYQHPKWTDFAWQDKAFIIKLQCKQFFWYHSINNLNFKIGRMLK